ncbi:MAG: hypothetical protein HOW73_25835, partial [Polyangiaceae bacterium]|nr:hypothetical protein [Polyangiaceae bacterium]
MLRRTPAILLAALLCIPACGDSDATGGGGSTSSTPSNGGSSTGGQSSDGGNGNEGGSPAQDWWRPAPGEARDWDWQITEPYDTSAPRAMYDLDLFDLATAGSYLEYPDGHTIDVPE